MSEECRAGPYRPTALAVTFPPLLRWGLVSSPQPPLLPPPLA